MRKHFRPSGHGQEHGIDPTLVDRFIQMCGHLNQQAPSPNQAASEIGGSARKQVDADSTKAAGAVLQPPVNMVAPIVTSL